MKQEEHGEKNSSQTYNFKKISQRSLHTLMLEILT